MKHLNFSTKSGSQSGSHRVVTLCTTVGSPSAHRRGTMLKHVAFLLLFLFAGFGQMWGDSYTITFSNNANNATAISSSVTAATTIASAGRTYVNSSPYTVNSGNCYYGGDGKNNIRVGKSGSSAGLSIALSASGQVSASTIVVNCMVMTGNKNTGGTLSVNGAAAQTAPTSANNLTFTINDDIESITLTSSKAVFIYSITVNYTATPSCSAPTSPNITGTTAYTAGQTISLTATASGTTNGTTTYQWYKGDPDNGGTSQGAASTSGATFTKANCVVGDAGTYYCVISNGTGCTAKTSKAITVSAPSYTVGWSITSGGGTLSATSGTSTTVTPTSGWRYADPAYTVLSGASGVLQSTNTFTATPTADCTIRINMEEIPSHNIIFNTGGLVSIDNASAKEGETYNIPNSAKTTVEGALTENCEYGTFVGWTTASSIADASVSPSIITSYTMSTSDVTLHAVYSKTTGGGGTNGSKTITHDLNNFPTGYAAAADYVISGCTLNIKQVYANGKMQWRSSTNSAGAGVIYNKSTFPAKITSIVLTYTTGDSGANIALKVGNSENPTSGTSITPSVDGDVQTFDCSGANADYFVLTNGSGVGCTSSLVINYGSSGTTTYSLDANCCNPLGQINGSVNLTQTTAALEWADLEHVSSWAVQYKEHSAENWNTWNGAQSTANSKRSVTITSLSCGTAYDFKIAATAAAGYCDDEQVLENKSTTKWNISYSLSGTVALSEGPAQGANACGEIEATFIKNSSYTFPDAITVTVGGAALAANQYTWNSSTGALSIAADKVTGNVVVTIAGQAPANPIVTPNPTALSFAQVKKGADVPAAQDIAITGQNLTADLVVESSNTSLYTVSVKSGSLTPDGNKDASPVITVTPQAGITSTAGDKNATITISGGGLASNVVVNVTFNVQETYTVNWYVNGTDNEHKARTQTDIVGTDLTEIPSDFSGVTDCSEKVFMGWTEDDDYTHATDAPADLITSTTGMKITAANKNYYAVFADKEGEDSNSWDLVTSASSLQENDIITLTSTCTYNYSSTAYYDTVAYAGKNNTLGAVASIGITNNKIRTVKSGSISEVKLVGGSSSGKWKLYDIAAEEYLNDANKAISYEESGDDVTIAISDGVATITDGDYTLQYNPNNNAGDYTKARFAYYSSTQKAIQIYKKTVTEATYSNYVVVCPHVSRVTLSAPSVSNGSISFEQSGSAVTSVRTDGGEDVEVDVVPDPATGYELTGVALSGTAASHASYDAGVITIDADAEGALTATATFSQKNYEVIVEEYPVIGATLTGATTTAHYNDEITISTNEPAGYKFSGWCMYEVTDIERETDIADQFFTGDYDEYEFATTAKFKMPNRSIVAEANFKKIYSVDEFMDTEFTKTNNKWYYVTGLVAEVPAELYSGTKMTYVISDDATKSGLYLTLYRGLGEDGENFSAVSDLAVGDKVVVYGQWSSSYKNLNEGNYILKDCLTKKALSALTIVGDASVTTYDVGDSFDKTGLSLSATYNTGYVQANYTGTTITSNYDAPTTFKAGVTSVTVSAEEGLISTSRDIEVTVSSAVLDYVEVAASAQTEFWAKEAYKEPLLDAHLTDASVMYNVTGVSNTTGLDMSVAGNKSVTVTYTRKAGQTDDVEYNFTVKPIAVDEEHAHSVATAREIIDVDKTDGEDLDLELAATKTHVVGVVTSVSALTGANAGKYTIVIKDQTDADKVMTLYQVTLKSGITSVAQNDIIKAYGNLYYHSQSSKYEINTGGEVVAVVRTPNLTVADVAEMEIKITADLGVDDLTIDKDGSNGDITFSCSDAAVTIVNNKLHAAAAGDATVTATIAADGIYTAATTTFSVHVIAERTRYAITMDKNGGSGDDPVYENQLAGATVNLPADNTYSKANSAFDAWVVTETVSGDAVAVTDGHFTMPAAAVTIKATWNDVETCAISFRVSGEEVATADAPQTAEFSLAGVSHPNVAGFTWIGWSETEYDDETTTLPTTISSYTPEVGESTKTLYGIYSQVVGGASNLHYVLDYEDDGVSDESLGYGNATDITATDGSEWVVKAYKNQGMQINTGKDASIKIPDCPADIISISITCGAAKAVGLSASDYSGSGTITYIVYGTDATSQTLDLSGEHVTGGYIVAKSGSTAITHIDVEYSGNVTYYTSSPITRYTITYAKGDATGVTGLCEAQRHAAGSITLCDAPTCADKNFAKWSDGTSLYNAGAEYTLSADVTFTANWTPKPKYTVTYTANGGIGTAPDVEEYMEGETVEVKENEYFEKPGFDYDGWLIVYNDGVSDQEITPENGEFEMVAYNVTIKAKWAEESKQKWALVTDVADLKAGDKYIIAAAGSNVAMAGQNANNRAETAVVKRNEGAQLKGTSSMQVITLAGTTGAWEFNTGAGYLYAAGSGKSNNYLRTQAENDANGKWTISITAAGVATITATGTNTNNQLKYNSSSKIFSCYGSGQAGVALYKEIPITVINDNDKDQDDVPDGGDMTIKEDKTWTVSSDKEVGDLYMEDGAIIANSAKVEANDLYFKARHGKSNQIFDLSQITVVSNMYYDFQLCDGDVDADYWYSISVPFDVDLNDGVFQVGGTTPLVNHTDFEVWEYNTTLRAQTQSNGWQRSKDNMMHAGKAYLIGFNPGQPNIIRLKAAPGWKTSLYDSAENENKMSVVSTGSGTHDNWNGLANPTGRYIDVDKDAQVFNNNTHGWDSYALDATRYNFVVGTAFFVQSASAITISNTDHGQYRAPKRADDTKCAYAVRITRDEATSFDNQIIVRASEEATGEYTQGHDMLTMNNATSKTAAMLWTENYGGKRLAIEEAAWMEDKASYVLKMYAPAAGTYHISVAETKANADLYLTYEGTIIWNLSMGEYPIDLNKGTTNGYGLLLQKKAPSVATGVETVTGDGLQVTGVQKIVIDDQVFILRGGKMYGVDGKMVK